MLLKASEADLRAAGLSFRKIEYLQGLAEAELSGALGIKTLGSLSDEEAIERIVQLRGFGRWSAEISCSRWIAGTSFPQMTLR